jgi:hypothetical protein
MSSGVRKWLGGSGFCMGWPVHVLQSHTKWAGFFRPPTLQKSYFAIFAARPTGQPPSPVPGVDCPVPGAPSRHTFPRRHPGQGRRQSTNWPRPLATRRGQDPRPTGQARRGRAACLTLPRGASIPGPGPTGRVLVGAARPEVPRPTGGPRPPPPSGPLVGAAPKTAGQLARSLARGSDPRGQGPGSETPLQAPGAAGPVDGRV